MARVGGINIPDHKHVVISLQSIYGVGQTQAVKVCEKANVNPANKVSNLSADEIDLIRGAVAELEIEGDLRRRIRENIKRLTDLSTYRGIRHRRRLPVHGQRTRTNARTRKGPKRAMRG